MPKGRRLGGRGRSGNTTAKKPEPRRNKQEAGGEKGPGKSPWGGKEEATKCQNAKKGGGKTGGGDGA